MSELKLFIWEGDGISDAYHDDGTLVVLARSAEEARQVMRDGRARDGLAHKAVEERGKELGFSERYYWAQSDRTGFDKYREEMSKKYPSDPAGQWDGTDEALDREPDQVIDIDGPKFVAFNGGGYD